MDSYGGSRALDDLKNYVTLKISEHSLLISSATTKDSEKAEEVPSDTSHADMVYPVFSLFKRTSQNKHPHVGAVQ